MNTKNMNLFGLIASILAGISVFLPYATAFFGGESFMEENQGLAIVILLIGVVGAIVSFLGISKGLLGIGVLAFIFFIVEEVIFRSNYDFAGLVKRGFGYWLLLLASAAMIVFGYLSMKKPKNNYYQDNNNNMYY